MLEASSAVGTICLALYPVDRLFQSYQSSNCFVHSGTLHLRWLAVITEISTGNKLFCLIVNNSSPGGLPTLSLTTNSSWCYLGRVAMPLISPLMPVPGWLTHVPGKWPLKRRVRELTTLLIYPTVPVCNFR